MCLVEKKKKKKEQPEAILPCRVTRVSTKNLGYRVRALRAPARALARKKAGNWTEREPGSAVYFVSVSAKSPHEERRNLVGLSAASSGFSL